MMKGYQSYTRNDIFVILFALGIVFLPVIFIVAGVLKYTNGVFMYPLDDTFIHLEIADHFANEGNWGINNGEFGSASSSLLYTVILSLFRLFSNSTIVPFIINCLAAIGLVWAAQRWLKKQQISSVAQGLILSIAILFTPLPTMVISGMEHTLQCLLVFLFIFRFSDWLEVYLQDRKTKLPVGLIILAVLVSLIRYEGLFLIGIAGLLLLGYRNIKAAFILGAIALLPVILFGVYSLSKGSYFLPNSVLVKSDTQSSGLASYFGNILVEKLTYAKSGMAALATQRWLLILPLLYLAFRKYMRSSHSFILIFLIVTTILQLALAATGWLYRYEAYLFFSSMIITCVLLYKYGREVFYKQPIIAKLVLAAVLFFMFFPIALRGMTALAKTKQACINIYDQQYQMAQFSKKYYYNTPIAANDIGAIAYFTESKIIDLWGLGTFEIAKSKKEKYWTPEFLDTFSKKNNVPFAMVYDIWFNDSLQNHWHKVGSWQIQNNVICGDDEVSFYAVDSTHIPLLKKQMQEFQPSLPSTVSVKYFQ